jgi:plasmid maintenance system antidote protein VapI
MDNVNKKANFASRFRELCTASAQNELSELFDVTKNTFRQWTNGNATPTVEKLIKLSEYFSVSSDYLLGLTDIKKADVSEREISEKYGLSETALSELSVNGKNENSLRFTKGIHGIINLLLSEKFGKEALIMLSLYFFAHPADDSSSFEFCWDYPYNSNSNSCSFTFSDREFQRMLLDRAMEGLSLLRFERDEANEEN